VKRALLFLALVFGLTGGAAAQVRDVQSIAAVVNHEVISVFDLLERMKLVIVSSDLKDTPETRQRLLPLVLRSLIDERLEMQEAQRLEITVGDEEINRALSQIEKQNNIKKGEINDFFAKAGVDTQTVLNQVRAGIAWGKVINRRIRPTIDIGDDEINEAYARVEANKDKPQNLLAEIFLAVDSPDKEPEVKAVAERLVREIRGGANFPALARQFSESASALSGGDLGWVAEGQLGPELDAAIKPLHPPALTEPVRTPGGYYILVLRDRKIPSFEEKGGVTVDLQRLHVDLAADAPKPVVDKQLQLARSLRDRAKSCDDMQKLADESGSSLSGNLGSIHLNELPDDLQKVVAKLPVGRVSDPLRRADGVTLLMVCNRTEEKSIIPTRDEVAEALLRQRLELQADRYLRDLRSNATVDTRI
jgi:peptidyl-prolyl cis-trans isomerase SurA